MVQGTIIAMLASAPPMSQTDMTIANQDAALNHRVHISVSGQLEAQIGVTLPLGVPSWRSSRGTRSQSTRRRTIT